MTEQSKSQQNIQNTDKKNIKKEPIEEFSLKWHLKVLSVIYIILAIFYLILKIFLK
ncbi:MAG: hypothetical protein N2114_03300 [Candidatus Goldbacteria bacterium]|nr:hypothetical protein [Candidatus Goldiibacteriota bacterium]